MIGSCMNFLMIWSSYSYLIYTWFVNRAKASRNLLLCVVFILLFYLHDHIQVWGQSQRQQSRLTDAEILYSDLQWWDDICCVGNQADVIKSLFYVVHITSHDILIR